MEFAEVKGLRIAYERAGHGPPLVLLHGIGSNSRSWRHQLSGLSDELTVVAWDAPGYGKSADPTGPMAMGDYAHALAGLLDALGFDKAHITGLSWGGVLAVEFYRHYADRVLSLVLADTFAGGRSRPEAARLEGLTMRLRHLEMPREQMARERAPVLLSPHASPELIQAVASITAEIHTEGYRLAAIAASEADERDVLPSIRVPALVIWGEHDRVTPRDEAELLHAAIPGSKLVVIPGAGHVSNQEQPAAFNDAVRAFLRAPTATRPR